MDDLFRVLGCLGNGSRQLQRDDGRSLVGIDQPFVVDQVVVKPAGHHVRSDGDERAGKFLHLCPKRGIVYRDRFGLHQDRFAERRCQLGLFEHVPGRPGLGLAEGRDKAEFRGERTVELAINYG